jgi:hypothetical protein
MGYEMTLAIVDVCLTSTNGDVAILSKLNGTTWIKMASERDFVSKNGRLVGLKTATILGGLRMTSWFVLAI